MAGVVIGLFLFPIGAAVFQVARNALEGKYSGLGGEQFADMLTSHYLQSRYFAISENVHNDEFRLVLKPLSADFPAVLVKGDKNGKTLRSVGILDASDKQVDLYFTEDGIIDRKNTSYTENGRLVVYFDYGCKGVWDMLTKGSELEVNHPDGTLKGEILNGKGTVNKNGEPHKVLVKENKLELIKENL